MVIWGLGGGGGTTPEKEDVRAWCFAAIQWQLVVAY